MFARRPRTRRERLAGPLRVRRAVRTTWIIAVAVITGVAASLFARLSDLSMHAHDQIWRASPLVAYLLLPLGFAAGAWLTRRFAPEAAGSGIPQVIAAAAQRWTGRWGGQRVTLKTALWKVALGAAMLVCGASLGREGPTVQVSAGLMRGLTRGLKGGPGRRAMIIAGGAAGVAAAFNTPIAGVVFAVEELAKSFDFRTNTNVILIVVISGLAAYAMQGDYAYFGVLNGEGSLTSAWMAAPVLGLVGGALGGLFARSLAFLIGPGSNPVANWRRSHPVLFALGCGFIAAGVALASGGLTFGAGYAEAKSLLQDHPGRGAGFAIAKFVATLVASAAGVPGGLFSPSLATGAGIGAAFVRLGFATAGRDAVVLGMTSYLSGVTQAPLTAAVIVMEMTRDPGLVGPLLLAALLARWASGWVQPEPLYHALSWNWRLQKAAHA
jgi:H+/Cl- antiporter ClcA